MRYLAEKTKNQKYRKVITKLYDSLKRIPTTNGLLPFYLNAETGEAGISSFGVDAMGDSYYEYLLKTWILEGKKDEVRVFGALYLGSAEDVQ